MVKNKLLNGIFIKHFNKQKIIYKVIYLSLTIKSYIYKYRKMSK